MSKKRRKPLPKQLITTTISRLNHDGRGVANIDGKITFLFGGLANETVRFKYTKQKNQYDEGEVKEIITASPARALPKCQHFSVCGGCSFQHFQSSKQLEHKQNVLLELLHHQAALKPKYLLPAITSYPWGYRRKARLSIKYVPKKGKVLAGFRERNGSFVADIHRCAVLHPSIGEKISHLSETLMTLDNREFIPQIEIAIGDDQTAIIIRHLKSLNHHDLEILENFSKTHFFTLYLQPKGLDSIHLQYPKENHLLLKYQLPNYHLTFEFHPSQFTQINHDVNHLMIDRAIELLAPNENDHILDLFCGIGNFTLPIAQFSKQVTGIEGDEQAVFRAKENAKLNHISNADFFVSNLFEPSIRAPWFQQRYDKILLDPPRAGAKEILAFASTWQAQRIVYISCNPATLARDAKILNEQGYQLETVGVIDMFPHTKHIEAISLFARVSKGK